MTQKTKSEILHKGISPVGEVKYEHLDAPDKRFDDEGRYSITLLFDDNDPKVKEWLNKIDKASTNKNLVLKREQETNYVSIQLHSKDKPKIVDAATHPMEEGVAVGWHSTARVNYCLAAYTGFGGGCTWYLNAVQVVKLVLRADEFDPIESQDEAAQGDEMPF